MLSSTVKVSVLIVDVVPLTVMLPLNIASSLNVLAPPMDCTPVVLTTVLSTANDLLAVISPPPSKPSPAVKVTLV